MCWRTKTQVGRNVFVLSLPLVSKVIVCLLWSKKPIFALMSRTQCSCTKDCDCWSKIHFCTAQSCTESNSVSCFSVLPLIYSLPWAPFSVCVTVCVCLLDIVVQKLLGCQAAQRCCQSVAGLKGNHVVFFFSCRVQLIHLKLQRHVLSVYLRPDNCASLQPFTAYETKSLLWHFNLKYIRWSLGCQPVWLTAAVFTPQEVRFIIYTTEFWEVSWGGSCQN